MLHAVQWVAVSLKFPQKKKKNCSRKNALNFVEEHVKPVQQHPQLSADVYFMLVEKQTVNQSHRKKIIQKKCSKMWSFLTRMKYSWKIKYVELD